MRKKVNREIGFFCVLKGGVKMLKKILREIDRLEQQKDKQEKILEATQAEISRIDEELKKYNSIKKQYEKLEATANELINK